MFHLQIPLFLFSKHEHVHVKSLDINPREATSHKTKHAGGLHPNRSWVLTSVESAWRIIEIITSLWPLHEFIVSESDHKTVRYKRPADLQAFSLSPRPPTGMPENLVHQQIYKLLPSQGPGLPYVCKGAIPI